MKRRMLTALLAAWMALTLAACGGSASLSEAKAEASAAEAPMEAAAAADTASYGTGGGWEEEGQTENGAGTDSRLQNAKLILTASMEVETTEFDSCAASLEDLVDSLGGYLEYASVSNYGGGYRNANYTVRVPAKQFHAFREQVGQLCHVVYQDQGQENISEAYYDTESRLTTQQTKLERLQALLAKAESMEDIITIESAISETELAIEQLTGTLRHYDALVDFATVTVSLREVYKLSNVEEPADSFGSRMGAAFSGGWTAFVDGLENVAVTLAYGWMWVLVLAVVIVVVVRIIRKRRKKSLPPAKQPPAEEK